MATTEVAEDVSPLGEAAVRGEGSWPPLITGVDELEEQIAVARNDREVADAAVQEAKGARAFLGVRLRLNSI